MLKESGIERQGAGTSSKNNREMLPSGVISDLLTGIFSHSFCTHPRTTCLDMVSLTVGYVLLNQLAIKTVTYRMSRNKYV